MVRISHAKKAAEKSKKRFSKLPSFRETERVQVSAEREMRRSWSQSFSRSPGIRRRARKPRVVNAGSILAEGKLKGKGEGCAGSNN